MYLDLAHELRVPDTDTDSDMTSFGETTIGSASRILGRVRVLGLEHGRATYPRILLKLGFQFHELSSTTVDSAKHLKGFEMRDLHGELRLGETDGALGLLAWAGPRRHVRSSSSVTEAQIDVACDLDWLRLDRIEAVRAGRDLTLWISLWPTLVGPEGYIDCEVGMLTASFPRDRFLAFSE